MKPEELRYNNLVALTDEARKDLFDCNEVIIKDNYHCVVAIQGTEINLYIDSMEIEFNYSDIKPIPLTEEWLKKFGFEKKEPWIKYGNGADWQPDYPKTEYVTHLKIINDNCFGIVFEKSSWIEKSIVINDHSKSIIFGDFYETQVDSSNFINCNIPEHVHQLQNLYHALTGVELQLK